ncbi:MAG: SIS domain-containing protein [Alloprevotella sp.]
MSKNREIAIQCLLDEAKAIEELTTHIDEDLDHAVETILRCKGKLIVTGVGKSGHIGAKIAATLSSTGTPSFFVNPLDVFHGDLGVIGKDDVVLAISNSGQTDELLRFMPYLLSNHIPVIAMTGNANSLLAKNANYHLYTGVNHEACPLNLAPTSSTTATLAMGDALACALMVARGFKANDFALFHPGGSLGRKLLTRAKDVMQTENLPIISRETNMGDALVTMSNGRLGLLIAVKDGKVEGVVTDGDVRRAMERHHTKFFSSTVAENMTRHPKCVSPDTKVVEIDEMMHNNKIHCVLVTDEQQRLIGVIDSFKVGAVK